jgi:predicted dehydrogenase
VIEGRQAGGAGRVLTYGMVGGGPGSFIGGVHRAAISLGGSAHLAAGCFSQDWAKNEETGQQLGLEPGRVYRDFSRMAQAEANRSDRIDFVVVTTPNKAHYPVCKAFLEHGIHVMCEKPLAASLDEAADLKTLATSSGCLFGVAYAYSGHVMAKEAREIIRSGQIGEVLMVMGEYPQDWLADIIETNQKQAAWRTDPAQAGQSNCTGDIGTHIENMVSFMTGLKIRQLCASLDIIGEGRTLDTNAEILIRYDNGARGCYWCSQVAIGNDNGLKIRVFGTKGSVEFDQENSNYLKVTFKGQAPQIYSRGAGYLSAAASAWARTPSGHPEGYYEAFANLYAAFCLAIRRKQAGEAVDEAASGYPAIDMGIDGVRFISKCVESSNRGAVWVDMD